MTDHPHALASSIAGVVGASGLHGHRRLPKFCRAAIEHVQDALWRDLTRTGALWSNIRLVHDGHDLHPRSYMTGRIGDGMIVHTALDNSKVAAYLADGATLVYSHLHETSHAVQRIQETLEYQLNARVWIQAYLTRTGESAFGMHIDDHNFIALQIFGSKTWELESEGRGTTTVKAATLNEGDIIGAPSNVPHRVTGDGTLSLHLTIAFDWVDDGRTGSAIPVEERESHRRAARLGSVVPFALCDQMDALRLPFRFRDRVRPTTSRRDRGVELTCNAGRLLLDHRFGSLIAQLADGAELTKHQILKRNPDIDENDLDKFLRFGVESELLLSSG